MFRLFVRWRWLIAGLAAFGLGIAYTSVRVETGTLSGNSLDGSFSAISNADTWRIATWNIHSGKGLDGQTDLARIASELDQFDLAGLNEVRGPGFLGGENQAQFLGQKLSAGSLFLPLERRFGREDFGNAVVSRSAVENWLRIPLPSSCAKGHGNVTLLKVGHLARPVRVLVTQIDHRVDRDHQLELVIDLFLSLAEPAVLMGDLNSSRADRRMSELLSTAGVVEPLEELGRTDERPQIDWIITRGLEIVDAGYQETTASDHPLIWAELRLPSVSPEGDTNPQPDRVIPISGIESNTE